MLRHTRPSYPWPSPLPVRMPVCMVDRVVVGVSIPHMFRIFELPFVVPWGSEEGLCFVCFWGGLGPRPPIGGDASRLARCYRVPFGVYRVPIL